MGFSTPIEYLCSMRATYLGITITLPQKTNKIITVKIPKFPVYADVVFCGSVKVNASVTFDVSGARSTPFVKLSALAWSMLLEGFPCLQIQACLWEEI